jgi:membrane protease YdiL (CAAX protease family)
MQVLKRVLFNAELRLRSSWWVVIFFLLLAALLFPTILLSDRYGFEISYWHQVLLIVIATILCQALRRESFFDLVGRFNKEWLRKLGAGLLLGCILMIVPALILTLTGSVQWQVNSISLLDFMAGILVMLSVVIAEELLFRGFIFQRLIESFGAWPAQLLMGALFLLTHLGNPGMAGSIKVLASMNIFIASVFFGIAYIKTRSLAMPIGIHFMANVIQGNILGFGVSGENEESILLPAFDNTPSWITGGTFGLEASMVGLVTLTILTTWLYIRRILIKYY